MKATEKIQAVINSLEMVCVRGYGNMKHIVSSIEVLNQVKNELETQEAKKDENTSEN